MYESRDPPAVARSLAESLGEFLPLHCTIWVCPDLRGVGACWPDPTDCSPELVDLALHAPRPEVYPLGPQFPAEAARFPGAEVLLLPLRDLDDCCGTALLIADAGRFGEDLDPWTPVTSALARVIGDHRRSRRAEQEAGTLRQWVGEAEALHTLGLAVNRTLDPDEVLSLVARFTRTLLGAHYVVVNTADEGLVHAVASVGLRDRDGAPGGYRFAREVVEAGKPLTIGTENSPFRVEEFPFHVAEGMETGVGIPLSLFGNTFGALVVGYRRSYTPAPRDLRLAFTLAGHAAVAISNARLHRTLGDRSVELEHTHAELEHTHAELEHTALLKERFFASMSHELRTPLNGIMGYQQLLIEGTAGELPAPALGFLDNANRAAANLLGLVNDILDYAKIEAGKVDLNLEPVPIAVLLTDAVSNVEPLAGQKGLRLTVTPGPSTGRVRTDPNRVRQILVNLLSNAIKFTPAGGEVALSAEEHAGTDDAEAPRHIEFRVRDTGPGIAPEDRDAVFREFEQVKGTKGGTGLGLPISHKLARLLGGDLWVESEFGHGSTFVLRLPLDRGVAAEPLAPANQTSVRER
ncbi:MAG: GAF domain-containing sensor histidine kinase [Gemmatimonadota bacterium]|nr:GAF domain-containing sensor histidine kinase [Gemmatimonadota bacterium]